MQAVQSADVLAIAASLTAETLCVSAVLYGQVLFVKDDVAIDIRDGHLGSGNQIEVVDLAVVHLAFLVRQLASAIARCGVDHRRRHNLCVAALRGLGQEEVDECALQLCTFTYINRETSSRNLHAQVEVDEVVLLSQFPASSQWGRGLSIPRLGLTFQLPTVSVPSHFLRFDFTTWLSSAAAPSGTSS